MTSIPELGSGTPPEAPAHSDAIVVVDRWGNVASVTHTINTILWGDTGMVVGGVPLANSAGFMQGALASLVPSARVPDTIATTITLTNGKPHRATAPVGSALIAETVRILLGILGNRLEPQTIRAAPPLLFDFARWNRFAIPEGKYAPEIRARLERLGARVRTVPDAEVQNTRGSVVLGAVDANSRQWLGFETAGPGVRVWGAAGRRRPRARGRYRSGGVGRFGRPLSALARIRRHDHARRRSSVPQATGQPKFKLFAESDRDYFYKTIDAQITFETDVSGHAARLVRRRLGRDTVGQRVDDEEASQIEQPQAVDAKLLASYVGRYRLAPKSVFTVTRVGDRLFAQGTDQPKFELFAASDYFFHARSFNAQITFEPDVGGKPRTLIVHRNGRDERGSDWGIGRNSCHAAERRADTDGICHLATRRRFRQNPTGSHRHHVGNPS